jgi:hypothetical protein
MSKKSSTEAPVHNGCVYCAYMPDYRPNRQPLPAPLAVEVVETPNGPRPLCAKHARDAVRA